MSIWNVLIHRVGRSVTGPMVCVDGTNRWKEENTAADGPVGRFLRSRCRTAAARVSCSLPRRYSRVSKPSSRI
jgi:hypothetical protein